MRFRTKFCTGFSKRKMTSFLSYKKEKQLISSSLRRYYPYQVKGFGFRIHLSRRLQHPRTLCDDSVSSSERSDTNIIQRIPSFVKGDFSFILIIFQKFFYDSDKKRRYNCLLFSWHIPKAMQHILAYRKQTEHGAKKYNGYISNSKENHTPSNGLKGAFGH